MIEAIPIMKGYIFCDSHLKGINEFGKIENIESHNIKDFFIKDRVIYFSIEKSIVEGEEVTKEIIFYRQEGVTTTEISQLPVAPIIPIRIKGDFLNYEIKIDEWEKEPFSIIFDKNKNRIVSNSDAFNSFVVFENCIYFSQKNDSARKAGIWYHSIDMNGGPRKIMDYSYIWKIN